MSLAATLRTWLHRLVRRTSYEITGPNPDRQEERRELHARQATVASRLAVLQARRHA